MAKFEQRTRDLCYTVSYPGRQSKLKETVENISILFRKRKYSWKKPATQVSITYKKYFRIVSKGTQNKIMRMHQCFKKTQLSISSCVFKVK